MLFKARFKHLTADRVLGPLRQQLLAGFGQSASVLEFGCGTGDLLLRGASQIRHGLGVDAEPAMIRFANLQRERRQLTHLRFECADASSLTPPVFDVATCTLFLHALTPCAARRVLQKMVASAGSVLVADYTVGGACKRMTRFSTAIDERLSGHYANYRQYGECGGVPAYVAAIDADLLEEQASVLDGISIWRIRGRGDGSQAMA